MLLHMFNAPSGKFIDFIITKNYNFSVKEELKYLLDKIVLCRVLGFSVSAVCLLGSRNQFPVQKCLCPPCLLPDNCVDHKAVSNK